MSGLNDLPLFEDDELPIPEVGPWAVEKYLRVWYYHQIFSKGMKDKWDQRVYIDLFSGAGLSRIRDAGRIVPSSPLLALSAPHRYTKYIFVEKDEQLLEALEARAARIAPDADISLYHGDANEDIEEIVRLIPPYGKGNTQLSFCFVDPFSVDLSFSAIERLSRGRNMDFLLLLALGMDANRNMALYLDENHERIGRFLGDPHWRETWKTAEQERQKFIYFLAIAYIDAMTRIGYEGTTPESMHPVRSDTKNLGLYYLAFFSRHELGHHYWQEVLHYTDPQLPLL